MVIANEKKGSQSPRSKDRSSRSCIRNASVYFLALGSISGFDTFNQITCTIERIVTLALSIGMGLTPDFNDVEWRTDDYSSCSRDITIGLVSAQVSLGNEFHGKKKPTQPRSRPSEDCYSVVCWTFRNRVHQGRQSLALYVAPVLHGSCPSVAVMS